MKKLLLLTTILAFSALAMPLHAGDAATDQALFNQTIKELKASNPDILAMQKKIIEFKQANEIQEAHKAEVEFLETIKPQVIERQPELTDFIENRIAGIRRKIQ